MFPICDAFDNARELVMTGSGSHDLPPVLRVPIGIACSAALAAGCSWAAGVTDPLSDPATRLVGGLVVGLFAAPAFTYALWRPPRLRKFLIISGINLATAMFLGAALGVAGSLFVAGPAFIMTCVSFGQDGRRAQLEYARARGVCPHCEYDLRGNESGVCPECGKGAG